jgi:hypothetical protein
MLDRPVNAPARWALSGLILVAAAALLLATQSRGLAARRVAGPARPPPLAWRPVADAGGAWRAWRQAGVHGRRLVVFSGRWSTIPASKAAPPDFPAIVASTAVGALGVESAGTPETALLLAAMDGTARDLTTVMPPEALGRRLQATRGAPGLRADPGLIFHPASGYQRLILACDLPVARTPAYAEPVLVLVEPSYLGDPACGDVEAWLAARGLTTDLALVALDDPAATDAQRAAARALAGLPTALGTSHGAAPPPPGATP